VGPDLFRADPDAPEAKHAAVVVHHQVGMGRVVLERGIKERVPDRVHAVLDGEPLELAVAALGTVHAEVVSPREEQFQDLFPVVEQLLRFRVHDHAVRGGRGAGSQELGVLFDFHHAHAAGPDRGEPLEVAEGGNVDIVLLGDFEDRVADDALAILAVKIQVISFMAYTSRTAAILCGWP